MTVKAIYEQKENKNYYEILEVTSTASKAEIRTARRKLLAKYHPDKHEGEDKKYAENLSALINGAFEALSDDEFRERYDSGGYRDEYTVSTFDTPRKVQRKELRDLKAKGLNLTAVAMLDSDTLLKGGVVTVETVGISTPDLEIPSEPRTITIPPLTSIDSFITFKGLGEQKGGDMNGDLTVIIKCHEKLNPVKSSLLGMRPSIPFIELELQKGEDKLVLGEPFTNSLKVKKEGDNPSLLFVKHSVETDSPLLIEY